MTSISQIFIYPVKSLAGIKVEKAIVTPRGLENDRRWLLIDENGVVVTQRTFPILVHFMTSVYDKGIKIAFRSDEINLRFGHFSQKKINVDVWGDIFQAYEVSETISDWFSSKLGQKVRLVYQADDCIRGVDKRYAPKETDIVSAADGYPILVLSEESLNDLNEKLIEKVELLRFRPNIVISGIAAFGEDLMEVTQFGNTQLVGVKNCGRCIMVTNNLKTAQLGKEPLNTLSRYRKVGSKILFGRNFVPSILGEIRVGDTVQSV